MATSPAVENWTLSGSLCFGGKIGMQGFWQHDGERNWWQRKECREGLAVELVLIHSNSLSHWFSLFQFARCFYIEFWQEPWEVGRKGCWCIGKKTVMARVGVEWLGAHSCERRRQDQLPQIQCSFFSFRGLRVELKQVPPGR